MYNTQDCFTGPKSRRKRLQKPSGNDLKDINNDPLKDIVRWHCGVTGRRWGSCSIRLKGKEAKARYNKKLRTNASGQAHSTTISNVNLSEGKDAALGC